MKEFRSLAEFAGYLAKVPALILIEQHEGLELAARVIEKEAKELIGEYHGSAGPFVAWKELADSTKEERVQQGFPENDPLLRDGLLRDAIEHRAGIFDAAIGVPDKEVQHSYRKKPDNIGEIAEYQELGTNGIPPRSFLGMAAVHKSEAVANILGRSVVKALMGGQVFGGKLPID